MSDFYKKLPMALKNERQFGQICWVPAPCVASSTLALRLGFLKVGVKIQDAPLELTPVSPDSFGKLSEGERANMKVKMPLPELGLSLSEEITVTKSKLRPAVLIHHACHNWRKEANFVAKIVGKRPEPKAHLFAPVYSLHKDDGALDFPEAFVKLVQAQEYPHILYLPAYVSPIRNDSMVVLSDMFQVGLHAFETTELCIDPDTLALKLMDWAEYLGDQATELNEKLAADSK